MLGMMRSHFGLLPPMPKGLYGQWDAHTHQLMTPGIIGGVIAAPEEVLVTPGFIGGVIAAPEEVLVSLKVAGVRGEVTVISKAAGLPLSQSQSRGL